MNIGKVCFSKQRQLNIFIMVGKGILNGNSDWDIGYCPAGIKGILKAEIKHAEGGKNNLEELKRIIKRVKYYIDYRIKELKENS